MIILYSLSALAEKLGTSHGYLKHLMLRVKKGELSSWRGFRFKALGEGKRSTWFAYPEKQDIQVINAHNDEVNE